MIDCHYRGRNAFGLFFFVSALPDGNSRGLVPPRLMRAYFVCFFFVFESLCLLIGHGSFLGHVALVVRRQAATSIKRRIVFFCFFWSGGRPWFGVSGFPNRRYRFVGISGFEGLI